MIPSEGQPPNPTGSRQPPPTSVQTQVPIPLDGLAAGIDLLDAVLVFNLADAQLHGVWIRAEIALRADDLVGSLRDVYRLSTFAGKRFAGAAGADRRGETSAPIVTIELAQRIALLRRARSHVVACLFDAMMPLGMARFVTARLTTLLEPELPLADAGEPHPKAPVAAPPRSRPEAMATDREAQAPHRDAEVPTQRRSHPPPNVDRARRLVAYLEAHAPEPHAVRYRLALRAGLTLAALERPEGLGPEAMVLIEAAVQDILGIDRAELRRIA